MVPGILVSIATFPGVIVHEFAHKLACDLLKVHVVEVKYFALSLFGGEAGYVLHAVPEQYRHGLAISGAPIVVNTVLALLVGIAAAAAIPSSTLQMGLMWLSASIAMHAFPSNQDMDNVREQSRGQHVGITVVSHIMYYFMVLLNVGRVFWLDLVYAVALLYFVGALL